MGSHMTYRGFYNTEFCKCLQCRIYIKIYKKRRIGYVCAKDRCAILRFIESEIFIGTVICPSFSHDYV